MVSLAYSAASQTNMRVGLGKVLVVEDEDLIRDTLGMALAEEGFEVLAAADGLTAMEMLGLCATGVVRSPSEINLIILDLMLPGMNGLDLCRLLRHHGLDTPVLILSAKGTEMDRVVGLEIGADDYLPKPFGMRELIARCRALRRRRSSHSQAAQEAVLRFQDITLNPRECRVYLRDEEINLSPKEFRILELFMSQPRRVWSRDQIIDKVWGHDFMGDNKTVDVHIRWIREKLEADPSKPEYLKTVRGFGYRLG